MKLQLTRLIAPGVALCLILPSCKKMGSDVSSPSPQAQLMNTTNMIDLGQDETNAEISDLTDNVSGSADCKVVTYSPSKDVYPHITTVDFGNGCEVSPGKIISGKRISTVYADRKTAPPGTLIAITSLNKYYVNGLHIAGSSKIYADNGATAGTLAFKIVATKNIKDGSGNTSTYIATHHSLQIGGNGTPEGSDDVFQVTGVATGTELDPSGTTKRSIWKATIDDANPVIQAKTCAFRSQGGVMIHIFQLLGGTDDEYLDYGDGTCDNAATLSVNNGTPEEVTLPLVFYAAHL